jgi:hypothetical protein
MQNLTIQLGSAHLRSFSGRPTCARTSVDRPDPPVSGTATRHYAATHLSAPAPLSVFGRQRARRTPAAGPPPPLPLFFPLCRAADAVRSSRHPLLFRPADRSADVLWIVSGALFLGSSGIYPNLSAPRERLPRTWTARRKHMLGVRGLAWEAYVSCWSGFPCRVYIDSNHHDSRI